MEQTEGRASSIIRRVAGGRESRLVPDQISDLREGVRSNVLLSAVLTGGAGTVPVRIRNLSPSGALLDGQDLPASGRVMLRRGHLNATAEVVWSADGECGIRFDEPIHVKEWVKRVVHLGQQRVDTIVAALKAGALPHSYANSSPGQNLDEISEQLAAVTSRLSLLPNMTTELAEQVLQLEALSKGLEQHAATSRSGAAIHLLR